MQTELEQLEEALQGVMHDNIGDIAEFVADNAKRLKELRDADAEANPSGYTTFACETCGGLNVEQDAYARWNPITEDDEISSTYDDTHCSDCDGECRSYRRNLSVREFERDWKDEKAKQDTHTELIAFVSIIADGNNEWACTCDHEHGATDEAHAPECIQAKAQALLAKVTP